MFLGKDMPLLEFLLASPRKTLPYLPLKDALHQLPLVGGAGVGGAALELGDVCFPFGLARESGEACHVALEVEVVGGVHDHEQAAAATVYLHVEDADFALAGNDFGPYVRMHFYIFRNHILVIYEGQCLAISFHLSV